MNQFLHICGRKAKTLRLTLARCSNWPRIILAKSGLDDGPAVVHFRDGFRLRIMPPLKQTWGEIFEPAIADVYGIANCDPDLIVDVGANIGAFGCRAAFFHRQAMIHAFEPSQPHVDLLHENLKLNRLDNVAVHKVVVTKDGRDVVFSRLGAGGGSGIFLHQGGESVSLPSITLASIDYAGFACAFIKLDCEGTEGELIEWICANLGALTPRILIACEYHHWCPVPLDRILKTLREHGFVAQPKLLFDEQYFFASRQ